MTFKTLAIAAFASAAMIGGASAIELNTENADRANLILTQPAAGSVIVEGRSSADFGPAALNTENADRDNVAALFGFVGTGPVVEGRSSSDFGPAALNTDNVDRANVLGR